MLNLKAGDLSARTGARIYRTGARAGSGRRELPRPAYEAILATLRGRREGPGDDAAGGVALAGGRGERGVTSATFYNRLRRYQREAGVGGSGVHILRHWARSCGGTQARAIEEVSAVPRPLVAGRDDDVPAAAGGQREEGWGAVAEAIGA